MVSVGLSPESKSSQNQETKKRTRVQIDDGKDAAMALRDLCTALRGGPADEEAKADAAVLEQQKLLVEFSSCLKDGARVSIARMSTKLSLQSTPVDEDTEPEEEPDDLSEEAILPHGVSNKALSCSPTSGVCPRRATVVARAAERRSSVVQASTVANKGRGRRQGTLLDSANSATLARKLSAMEKAFQQSQDDARLRIFSRLADDGELHKDHLLAAIQAAGFPKPNIEWVAEILGRLTPYITIDMNEFNAFMEEYELKEQEQSQALFLEYDADGSGALDMDEISHLFAFLGFTPMAHVIEDIIKDVGTKSPGELSFGEFWQVMLHLRINEGFSRAENEKFMELFKTFDADFSGELEAKELARILVYLGYAMEPDVVADILKEVDCDGNGSLDAREFQVCMRKVREREVQHTKRIFAECDEDGSGGIDPPELLKILRSLGYFPEMEEISDALAEIHHDPEEELNFDQLFHFLEVFRNSEGFSRADLAEIRKVFDIVDEDGSGQLEVSELSHMFALLGCSTTCNQAQRFVANVDIDGSGTLDFREFTKVVRQLSQNDCQKARQAFINKGQDGGKPKISEVLQTLVPLALDKDMDKAASRLSELEEANEGNLDQFDFVANIVALRKKTAEYMKRNEGFGYAEVNGLRKQFSFYDASKTGFLNDAEVCHLFEDLYPDLCESSLYRPKLLEIMKTTERGKVEFREFLKLARKCRDLSDRQKVLREREAMKITGFSQLEVKEFRDLFLEKGDREKMALPQLLEMLAPLVPMGQKNSIALAEIFSEVVQRNGKSEEAAEFSDFLLIFRRMIDLDTGNINASARVAASGASF
jgi:calmodulin